MSSTLVDSVVLIDLFDEDSEWRGWADATLEDCAERGPLVINPVIYAEVAAGFDSIDALDEALPPEFVRREPLPWQAGFLAGHAFVQYRAKGGTRRSPLADFYIGAHAAVAGYTLLTRDARRYRYYFPKLRVISP
jgi:predicted nucleic acid-binding protein